MEQQCLEALKQATALYPWELRRLHETPVRQGRYAFRMELSHKNNGRLLSLGGGLDPSLLALRLLGMQIAIIDDYSQRYYEMPDYRIAREKFSAHGVQIVQGDLLTSNFEIVEDSSVDCVSSFDCLEHLHHSPKAAFERAVAKLSQGGRFIIGVPNAVNLAKRLRCLTQRRTLRSSTVLPWLGSACGWPLRRR